MSRKGHMQSHASARSKNSKSETPQVVCGLEIIRSHGFRPFKLTVSGSGLGSSKDSTG